VLGLFHIGEKDREMDDARSVGISKFHATGRTEWGGQAITLQRRAADP
jgi:hypothetical protein